MSEHVVGVNGCHGGWLVCRLNIATGAVDLLATAATFAQIVEREETARYIAIDIPIGLPEPGASRRCDLEARRLLTRIRASSVFPAPSRLFLGEPNHANASAKSREICGKGIPAQAHSIFSKVADVDRIMTPELQGQVFEVHPELCFFGFAGHPMEGRKSTPEGYEERRGALAKVIPFEFPERAGVRRLDLPIEPDDLLDAAAAAATAYVPFSGKQSAFQSSRKSTATAPYGDGLLTASAKITNIFHSWSCNSVTELVSEYERGSTQNR
jgi:predicted RNase H-like nuclease